MVHREDAMRIGKIWAPLARAIAATGTDSMSIA